MLYNGTENLRAEFSTEIYLMDGQFSTTGMSHGTRWIETVTFRLGVRITKFLADYTGYGFSSTFGHVSIKIWLRLKRTIWFAGGLTDTGSDITLGQMSSQDNKKGVNKSSEFGKFVAEIILGLHNKDPPNI